MGDAIAMGASRFCGNCGTRVTTRFCTNCGGKIEGFVAEPPPRKRVASLFAAASDQSAATSAQDAAAQESADEPEAKTMWEQLLGDANSPANIALSFAVAPVDTIIRLTDDPTYKTQWRFMVACTGIVLTVMFTIMPKLVESDDPYPKATATLAQANMYVSYFLMTPLQYHLCRSLGGRARTLGQYFKLCALSTGYTGILVIPSMILAGLLVVPLILTGLARAEDFQQGLLGPALSEAAFVVPAAIFITLSHRRFWGFSMTRATIATVVLLAVTVALGLGLDKLEHNARLPQLIESWLG